MASADASEGAPEAERRSKPGWSLARDAPRPKAKQGWECPAPTVEDWEDYKKWKAGQERKEELPPAPQIFLADFDLLFYRDADVQLPWIHRLKCELPRRVGRLSGELPVKASYIGFAYGDGPERYERFVAAMAQINIVLCRQIHHPANRFEIAHLEQSDLVLVDGGDRKRLWETLGTDVGCSPVAEHVKWRYLQGAVVIAVGEAMCLLGDKSWYPLGEDRGIVPFGGWKIFPHVVASEEEGVDLEDAVPQLGRAGVVIMGISAGGGMIFNKDGLVEPVRHMVQEYRWDWQSESVKRALLLGPPRSTGLICPLYAAMKRRRTEGGDGRDQGECDEEEGADVFAYALTQEEEQEEDHFLEHFDVHNAWLHPEACEEVERLKQEGNDAFKAGQADLAGLKYEQARVTLRSGSRRWSELDAEVKAVLDAGRKEEFRASSILVALLLNICAGSLLMHDQDVQRRSRESTAGSGGPADHTPAETSGQATTTLVEVRDALVAAFRTANDALRLSGCRSAKAWYRRACVFEKMRDPRNALRDLEEALLRAPGDKAVARKRDEVKAKADSVAESMYYARHKELDAQERRLGLAERRCLLLRGTYGDPFDDAGAEFALAQPIARLVEATLEEVDGRPRLATPGPPVAASQNSPSDPPYLHVHALWSWEFMVQRAPSLQVLHIEDVDLGSGPLEWLCKGLRTHAEIRVLKLIGVHLGPAGAKMMRNVVAQSKSLLEISLNCCALLDAGLAEIAEGLRDNAGCLEALSLQRNMFTSKRLPALASVFCAKAEDGGGPDLAELDLGGNPLGVDGAKELARVIASDAHKLRVLRLQDCMLDLAAFWRLVGNLSDARPLAQLDLRGNPIGRGTRRCWRGQMGPSIRCEVLLSDHPLKARREILLEAEEADDASAGSYPLPRHWA